MLVKEMATSMSVREVSTKSRAGFWSSRSCSSCRSRSAAGLGPAAYAPASAATVLAALAAPAAPPHARPHQRAPLLAAAARSPRQGPAGGAAPGSGCQT